MKDYCISCVYFKGIKNIVGYCSVLGVAIEKDIAIIDTIDTLKTVITSEEQKIYENIVVQSYFGCPLFEDKNAKLQLQ
jgi:hypothetical protein